MPERSQGISCRLAPADSRFINTSCTFNSQAYNTVVASPGRRVATVSEESYTDTYHKTPTLHDSHRVLVWPTCLNLASSGFSRICDLEIPTPVRGYSGSDTEQVKPGYQPIYKERMCGYSLYADLCSFPYTCHAAKSKIKPYLNLTWQCRISAAAHLQIHLAATEDPYIIQTPTLLES
ncbi:hypothetical protein DFH09DRAFT_1076701 [Mycena vulgaris]|nr:hypothetical protein DFH09DRAFT_1076701 [Mycena vulgaris]